jgi:hypothetical protein
MTAKCQYEFQDGSLCQVRVQAGRRWCASHARSVVTPAELAHLRACREVIAALWQNAQNLLRIHQNMGLPARCDGVVWREFVEAVEQARAYLAKAPKL